MHRLFVYGTLMRGESNARFLEAAAFIGLTRTAPRYTLLDLGEYPGLCEGGATSVVGELYDVDRGTLARLDELEGYPELFGRGPIVLLAGAEAIAYLLARDGPGSPIASGDWRRRRRSSPRIDHG